MWWAVVFFGGFLVGAVALIALEGLAVYLVIQRLNHRQEPKSSSGSSSVDLDAHQSLEYAYNKKGVVWVLEPEKLMVEKVPKEQKKKKEVFEVSPVRKLAKIKDKFLILTDSDGSSAAIPLKGCVIEAVSASNFPSRKWAKRFPLKLESKNSVIYNGSKMIFFYLETSWEKESWCKALRLASCNDKERLKWITKLNEEFHSYLASLNTGYHSLMKPSAGFSVDPTDNMSRIDGSASKVRLFWKKLTKKAPRAGLDNKGTHPVGREDRKIPEKCRSLQDSLLAGSLVKTTPTTKGPLSSEEENITLPSAISCSASQSHSSVVSDADADDKLNIDEGTLCWNLLISRLFFDAKSNSEMKSSVQARIQRALSNIRTPSYIGEIICTGLDLGKLPPCMHAIRVLPMDMNEVWAWEVDVEYSGGVLLDIETRLEVSDQDFQKGLVDSNSDSSSVGGVSSDLLEGFEYLGKQLNLDQGTTDAQERKDEMDPKLDGPKSFGSSIPSSTNVSRWKSVLNSVAKQVSQVPLSLSIRVAYLRGTLRLHIKPPPSDQLWYSFTSMPEIEFDLESSVGDHKITSGHVAFFLINRFKASIRETMVLPNCESVYIPWMLAEKNDWVPRKVAPFIWINRENAGDRSTAHEVINAQSDESKTKSEASTGASFDHPESKSVSDASDPLASSLSSTNPSIPSSKSLQDLSTPLLARSESQETSQPSKVSVSECQSPARSTTPIEKQSRSIEEDESRIKRMGRRAKMLDLGKRMGEKLEEKRRHIEEKSRNFVEKMRGP